MDEDKIVELEKRIEKLENALFNLPKNKCDICNEKAKVCVELKGDEYNFCEKHFKIIVASNPLAELKLKNIYIDQE